MRKAILIPANPKLDYGEMGSGIGSILAHATHIEEKGAVIWELVVPGQTSTGGGKMKFKDEIRTGYFYDVPTGMVTHKFEIEWIKNSDEILWEDVRKYDQPSRLAYYGTPKNDLIEDWPRRLTQKEINKLLGTDVNSPADEIGDVNLEEIRRGFELLKKNGELPFFYLLIRKICLLKTFKPLSDFKKIVDDKSVKNLRNYAVVSDPEFPHYDNSITREDMMSDYIADLLIRSKEVYEKDIEDLFFFHLLKTKIFVSRQGDYRDYGRLDLLFKDEKGSYFLYELKRDIANKDAIEQVLRYAKAVTHKFRISPKRLKAYVVARDFENATKVEARRKNIELLRYSFEIKTSEVS